MIQEALEASDDQGSLKLMFGLLFAVCFLASLFLTFGVEDK